MGMSRQPQYKWTDDQEKMVLELYQLEGPKRLSEMMGLPLRVVSRKAARLGIKTGPSRKSTRSTAHLEERNRLVLERYEIDGGPTKLAVELGLHKTTINTIARRLGLDTNVGKVRAGERRGLDNTTCNIHYFDVWADGMAYVLGFLFADGSIRKGLNSIIVAIAPSDSCIIEYITKEVRYKGRIYTKGGSVDALGHKREGFVWLALRSKILAQKAFTLGLKPRKTYLDEPFPSVPVEMLPHFIRGYFDGDGTAYLTTEKRWKTLKQGCRVGFIGSTEFIKGIHDALVEKANLSKRPVEIEQGKNTKWARVRWRSREDLQKFYNYIYPPNYPFCLERKRRVIADWLSQEAQTIRTNPK